MISPPLPKQLNAFVAMWLSIVALLFSGQAVSMENTPPMLSSMQKTINDTDFNSALKNADMGTLFEKNIEISLPKVVLVPKICGGRSWWRWCTPEVSLGPVNTKLVALEVSLVDLTQGGVELTKIDFAENNEQIFVDGSIKNVNFGLEVKSHVIGLTPTVQTILDVLNLDHLLDALDGNFTANLSMSRLGFSSDMGLIGNGLVNNNRVDATVTDIKPVGLTNFDDDFLLNIDVPDTFNVFGFGLAQISVDVITLGTIGVKDFLVEAQLLRNLGPVIANVITHSLLGNMGPAYAEVDFSEREYPKSLMGFLHGTKDTAHIPDEFLQPLLNSDVSWRVRGHQDIVSAAWGLGVEKPIVVVSDTWNWTAPSRNWTAWENHVRGLAQQYGTDVIYDIINEPDNPLFWSAENGHHPTLGWADLHETFKRAHDVIRAELGEDALISGPAFTLLWGSESRLYDFVRYCHENNLKIQILAIHTIYQADSFLGEVSKTLRQYHHDFIESGQYSGMGVEEIHVNEYGIPKSYIRPGTIVATLRELEKGKVAAANRASWGTRSEDCINIIHCYIAFAMPSDNAPDVLGDIMFSYTEPRPVWWVYKYYAAGVESRIKAETMSKYLMPIASSESDVPDQAQVIIGTHDSLMRSVMHTASLTGPEQITLKLTNVVDLSFVTADSQGLDIEVKKIIHTETAALMSLPTVMESHVEIDDEGSVTLTLDPLNDYEVYVVLIRNPNSVSVN